MTHTIAQPLKRPRDIYYRDALEHFGTLQSLVEAGYFEDGLDDPIFKRLITPHWLTTPLAAIIENLRNVRDHRPKVVLLTTGGFAPLHDGHLQMMHTARDILTHQGFAVVGGFFSPSHDEYVLKKCAHQSGWSAPYRLEKINHTLRDSPWLMADPWEALYVPKAIGFGDVFMRLQSYLHHHLPGENITVAYVFGSDNAFFYRPFCRRGIAVCVARPGHEHEHERARLEARSCENPHLYFSDLNNAAHVQTDLSSRTLRDELTENVPVSPSSASYLIRDDLHWATRIWADQLDSSQLDLATRHFMQGLVAALGAVFKTHQTPDMPCDMTIVPLSTTAQIQYVRQLEHNQKVLNLDPVSASPESFLAYSRLFDLSGPQLFANAVVPRPGYSNTGQMAPQIPDGAYTLVDDDIATRTTLQAITSFLPERVSITEWISLAETEYLKYFSDDFSAAPPVWDIVDARDFLWGCRDSGLVVRLFDGSIARSPYCEPYVSLTARAKIPATATLEFSMKVLELNRRFHESLSVLITLKQADPGFQQTMKLAGFASSASMLEIIDWHETFLRQGFAAQSHKLLR